MIAILEYLRSVKGRSTRGRFDAWCLEIIIVIGVSGLIGTMMRDGSVAVTPSAVTEANHARHSGLRR